MDILWIIAGHLAIFVALVNIALGVCAYGMIFAYFQRYTGFTEEEAVAELYIDMKQGWTFGWRGVFGLIKAISYLMENGGWDTDQHVPVYGFKFLPRHEYRYRT